MASALHNLTLQISVFDDEKITNEELDKQKETA